jgi:hypothetical protein
MSAISWTGWVLSGWCTLVFIFFLISDDGVGELISVLFRVMFDSFRRIHSV